MAIVGNEACPQCQANGHDRHSNHLLVFEDGARYCGRTEYHKDGKKFYSEGSGDVIKALFESDVTGEVKYTVRQFRELAKAGKFNNADIRAVALSGMKAKDRWEVSNEDERTDMVFVRGCAETYFNLLKIRNLVSRGIRGDVAKRFDVRVGICPETNKVTQHYYPVHDHNGAWQGAKCRTLPKEFGYDTLGWTWGETMMFGQKASIEDLKSGGRKFKLLLVGGECDAMAAWQMLKDHDKSGKYHYHIWSPVHGEKAMEDILANKDAINQYEQIIVAFDNDSVGNDMNLKVSRQFRGKTQFLLYPTGCKDANQCLLEGREAEFVDAWFNPVDSLPESMVKSVTQMSDKAKETPAMGQHWPWSKMNAITIGIRENMLYVVGAGSGVGKTHYTKEVMFHIMELYTEPVGVIYLEEPPIKTLRSYAGRYLGNKRIDLPPNDPSDLESYMVERDYTKEEADEAIDRLESLGNLFIADTKGDKSIDAVMRCVDDFMAMGIRKIVIDNLTAITHPKSGNKVEAIDETMKTIGSYKDENPCTIWLISHLKRVGGEGSTRKPHTHGGEVWESDFRGSGAIVMWANYVFGIERNVMADTETEKRTTRIRCVKDRDFGMFTGRVVELYGDPKTGRLTQIEAANLPKPQDAFDKGEY